jgi:uncharacterized protein YecA (UPF0149 family)
MNILKLTPKPDPVEALRFDATDTAQQEAMADWCNGRLRGMRLTPEDRIIQMDGPHGEIEASFGDWIVREASGEFRVLTDAAVRLLYDGMQDLEEAPAP